MAKPVDVDLSGRICMVTGATSGIGMAVAEDLARLGAHVVFACRNEAKARAVMDRITADSGHDRLELMQVDLSSPRSILEATAAFSKQHDKLDVLVNNASVWPRRRRETDDGLEMTFATNVLGYHLLTKRLLPLLRNGTNARIVNVASGFAGQLDMNDLMFARRYFIGALAYRQSKQANRMLSWHLAEALVEDGITVNACHPGGVNTGLHRDAPGLGGVIFRLGNKLLRSPSQGADTVTWLAASPEMAGISARFWKDRRELRRKFYDPSRMAALYHRCEALVAGFEAEFSDSGCEPADG